MAMYICYSCGGGVSAGSMHVCQPLPFNVLAKKTTDLLTPKTVNGKAGRDK